jgi:hypothetical protein
MNCIPSHALPHGSCLGIGTTLPLQPHNFLVQIHVRRSHTISLDDILVHTHMLFEIMHPIISHIRGMSGCICVCHPINISHHRTAAPCHRCHPVYFRSACSRVINSHSTAECYVAEPNSNKGHKHYGVGLINWVLFAIGRKTSAGDIKGKQLRTKRGKPVVTGTLMSINKL